MSADQGRAARLQVDLSLTTFESWYGIGFDRENANWALSGCEPLIRCNMTGHVRGQVPTPSVFQEAGLIGNKYIPRCLCVGINEIFLLPRRGKWINALRYCAPSRISSQKKPLVCALGDSGIFPFQVGVIRPVTSISGTALHKGCCRRPYALCVKPVGSLP